jgi:adenylate cyclase
VPDVNADLAAELGLTADERRLVAGLMRMGVGPDQIRDAAKHGRLEDAAFEGVLDPERDRRTISAAAIEDDGGLPAADIRAILNAMGLPPPAEDDPYFTPEEARVFAELGRARDLWPPEVRLQVARVYGQALGRIAQTEQHVFRSQVQPWIEEVTPNPLDALIAVRQAFELLLPLADPMLLGVHRRKLEQELTQAAVWEVELEAEGLVPGTVEVSLLFCDLRHFTSYANRHGDTVAIGVLDRFAEAVSENLGETGRLVKALGDGFLLAYPEPEAAAAGALRVSAAMAGTGRPALHAGLHHGLAVFRDGDYFGRAVNLAARLLSVAGGNELLATEGVAKASPDLPWVPRGPRRLRGFDTELEVFSLEL